MVVGQHIGHDQDHRRFRPLLYVRRRKQQMKQLFTFGENDLLVRELLRHDVRFLIVGGLAVQFYVPEREADDLDLLIEQTPENAERLFSTFTELHLTPQFEKHIISQPSERPQQLPLKAIYYADIVTPGRDIDFAVEWLRSSQALLWQNCVRVAARELLISMKRSSGRETDLRDVSLLQNEGRSDTCNTG